MAAKQYLKKVIDQVAGTDGWDVEKKTIQGMPMWQLFPPNKGRILQVNVTPPNDATVNKFLKDLEAAGWSAALYEAQVAKEKAAAKKEDAQANVEALAAAGSAKAAVKKTAARSVPAAALTQEDADAILATTSSLLAAAPQVPAAFTGPIPAHASRMSVDSPVPWTVVNRIWTPELATAVLECTVCNKRPVSDRWIERFNKEMEEGGWALTTQGVTLDEHGCVLDGQHRLWGVFYYNKPLPIITWLGVPSELFSKYDQGHRRTFADLAVIDNVTVAPKREGVDGMSGAALGQIIRLLIRYDSNRPIREWASMRHTEPEVLGIHKSEYADLDLPATAEYSKRMGGKRPGISTAASGAFRYLVLRSWPEAGPVLEEFTTGVCTGADSKGVMLPEHNAARMLHEFVTEPNRKWTNAATEQLGLLLKCFGNFCGGVELRVVSWKSTEDIPPVYDLDGPSFATQVRKWAESRQKGWALEKITVDGKVRPVRAPAPSAAMTARIRQLRDGGMGVYEIADVIREEFGQAPALSALYRVVRSHDK